MQKAGRVSISGLRFRFRTNSELIVFFLILADYDNGRAEFSADAHGASNRAGAAQQRCGAALAECELWKGIGARKEIRHWP
jgi:hypothetical protein